MFRLFLRQWQNRIASSSRSSRRAGRRGRPRDRLGLEWLEDRCLPSGGGLSFADPIDINLGAGKSPKSIATGDFRGIGIQDLAVADSGSNEVSILLGNGDGTFHLVETLAVGASPSFITTGHFHDATTVDLAVVDSGSNQVSILLGHGDGSFGLPHNFSVGSNPSSLAIGDFRGIGIQDLAVANRASNNVSILLGNGDGTFAAASSIAVGGSATFVVAFTGTGVQDLAVATVDSSVYARGTVSILLGDGHGTFRPGQSLTAVGRGLTSMAVQDFKGDGVADLAVVGSLTDSVAILLGRGDGSFTLGQTYEVGGRPQSIAVGHFNSDRVLDLVTVGDYALTSVLLGNGDGTFQSTQYFWGGANPFSVAVGDFTGAGRDDLAVVQNFTNQVSVFLNNSPQLADGVTVYRDIVYYDGPYSNPQRQDLDVYVPPEATNFPVVFLAYGGAFRNGDKSRLAYLAQTLARKGMGVVAINYRITDGSSQQVVFPAHEMDVARAFAWTYHHIAYYGGDPNTIVVMGHSSGTNLVSLLATDRRYLAAQGLSVDQIRGVIAVSGSYDLRDQSDSADVFGDEQQRWEASPLKYVDGTQPPFLVLYASNDTPGIAEKSSTFAQALADAGSEAELHMIPGRNHQMILSDAARPGDPARDLILRFITGHVGAPQGGGPFAVHAGNSGAPAAMKVAFRQEDGNLRQVLGSLSGSYTLGSGAAQSGNYKEDSQPSQWRIDGTVAGTLTPSGTASGVGGVGCAKRTLRTAGAHTIAVVGLNSDDGDDTALIDQVFLELA